ncbi:MAG: carboxynorspermidine decarboxylase [Verrucomicrobiota bacterium]
MDPQRVATLTERAIRFPEPGELGVLLQEAESPSYVLVERQFRYNLSVLERVAKESGAKILIALKAFACRPLLPLLSKVVSGASASSPHEARLAFEEVGGEVFLCSPAYGSEDWKSLDGRLDKVVFNSLAQKDLWMRTIVRDHAPVDFGLRINPEHSEVNIELYDPCFDGSRLGVRSEDLSLTDLSGISGLHFHTLCENDVDALERTLAVVEGKFGWSFRYLDWVNLGGGLQITRDEFEVDRLIHLLDEFRKRTGLEVYLEPGEAFALGAGVLVTTVLDIVQNKGERAILDISAMAHMPDVLEMPYRPEVWGAWRKGEKPFDYQLCGRSCLAGDVVGDYSFDHPLKVGDRLVFGDMGQYTMVKNTTFNGLQLPSIAVLREDGTLETTKRFGYETFRERLG